MLWAEKAWRSRLPGNCHPSPQRVAREAEVHALVGAGKLPDVVRAEITVDYPSRMISGQSVGHLAAHCDGVSPVPLRPEIRREVSTVEEFFQPRSAANWGTDRNQVGFHPDDMGTWTAS
jgi:hypothetical protein